MPAPAMLTTRSLTILVVVVAVLVCAQLDDVTRGASAWVLAALLLLAALAVVFWPRKHGPLAPDEPERVRTLDLLRAGLVLGFTGFGGGYAVLTQIEHRAVERERWLSSADFVEAAALGQSLPGAVAFNVLGFIGWRLARLRGALALTVGFVLPSFLMLLVFALLYARLRQVAAVQGLFHLLNPAVAGLVGAMTMRLATRVVSAPDGTPAGWRGLLRDRWALAVLLGAGVCVGVVGLGVPEVVLAAGLVGLARHEWRRRTEPGNGALALVPLVPFLARFGLVSESAWGSLHRLGELVGVFLRAGALTFGGGFVMIPLLEAELVQGRHWLTPQAFVDAMTLGQVTPGPVVITATFVGYTLAGLAGAILSTIAVFLPSFALVTLVGASLERFRRAPGVQAFLQGLQPAVVGLMAAATATLVRHGVHDVAGVVVAVVSFLLLWRTRLNPMWVVLATGVLGAVVGLLPRG